MFVFAEVAPSLGMAESVIDLFFASIATAANARSQNVFPQNFGMPCICFELDVEY